LASALQVIRLYLGAASPSPGTFTQTHLDICGDQAQTQCPLSSGSCVGGGSVGGSIGTTGTCAHGGL
jgi:hypothetical protein